MRSTTMFPSRNIARALTVSLVTGLAAISLDACQNDVPVAPSLRAEQASAEKGGGNQLGRLGNGILQWQLKDGALNTLLPGGTFKLTGPNNYSQTIVDNVAPGDQDAVGGQFKVTGLFPGIYTLCETVPPPKFVLPDPKWVSSCTNATIVGNGTTGGLLFFNEHIPRGAWSVVDPVGNPLGGSYFVLTDSLNVQTPVLDDSPQDLDKTFGYFLKELINTGPYMVCQVLPPSGYVLPVPNCRGIWAVTGNQQNWGKWVNAPNYSLYFDVKDPNGKLLSGTKFAILQPNKLPNMHVADNVTPDRDPVTGKYFITLPTAGYYVICQEDAPYGYDIPTAYDGCSPVALNVKLGVPANGGTFVDKPWPIPR